MLIRVQTQRHGQYIWQFRQILGSNTYLLNCHPQMEEVMGCHLRNISIDMTIIMYWASINTNKLYNNIDNKWTTSHCHEASVNGCKCNTIIHGWVKSVVYWESCKEHKLLTCICLSTIHDCADLICKLEQPIIHCQRFMLYSTSVVSDVIFLDPLLKITSPLLILNSY